MAKILFIHDTPRMSGPANSFLKLYEYLKVSYEITVAVPGQGAFTRILDEKNIPWQVIPVRYKSIPGLMRMIGRGNFDLVYGNNFSTPSLKALLVSRVLGKPFIWHIREVFSPVVRRPWLVRCLKFADALIAVSDASARAIQYHLPGQAVNVVHNGVVPGELSRDRESAKREVYAKLGMAGDEILVLGVGHICSRKNQLQAVEAAAKVIETHPRVKFCFLGLLDHSPDYTVSLQEQIARLGIGNNIFLPGFHEDIAAYLRGADIFLHTALKDPHPRSLLEGMAAELPVVAYDVDGVSETVVNEKTGYLVSPNDIETLARRMAELVASPVLRAQMGQAGYQRIQAHFTAEQTAQRVNTIIKSLLP
jgi:glycosyltransferase involved in cell wall biosynthesis